MIKTDRDLPECVDLRLDHELMRGYTSASQIAKRLTEDWAARNLYCFACDARKLEPFAANTKVRDFRCAKCQTTLQLKSKSAPFGASVANSAYHVKIQAIKDGDAPNYAFLQYSLSELEIVELFVLPGHLLTTDLVQPRKPLSPTARRAGWVGSNILLGKLPAHARVYVVKDRAAIAQAEVRARWAQYAFLRGDARARGGWAADVLECIRHLQVAEQRDTFSLEEFYLRYRGLLARRHPNNHHVDDKIRQQLQVLRDGGVLLFMGRGSYQITPDAPFPP